MGRIGIAFVAQPYSIRETISATLEAEHLGFESAWVTEDIWTGRDAVSVLSCLAMETSRMKLGTAVVNMYTRHPILIAQTFNALSELAPGRLMLGIGAGMPWKPFLSDWAQPLHPLADMRRAVETIRKLMQGEEAEWGEGSLRLAVSRKCFSTALPASQLGLPIYMGAIGPRMTELAGEIADGLMLRLAVPKEDVPRILLQAGLGAQRAGRDVKALDILELVLISASENGAIHPNALGYAVKSIASLSPDELQRYDLDPKLVRRIREAYTSGDCSSANRLITPEMVSMFIAAGRQEECLRFVEGIVQSGVKLPILLPFGGDLRPVLEVGAEFLRRHTQ